MVSLFGWLTLAILFSVEINELFSMLRPSLSSDGINVHVPIILFGSLTPIFMSIFLNSPGLNVICFGKYNAKVLFPKLLVSSHFYRQKK